MAALRHVVQNHRTVLTHNNTLLIFTRFKSSHLLSKFASRSNVLLFFRQCLSRGHYRPTWLPPKRVYLLNNISMHRCLSSNYFCRKEPTEKKEQLDSFTFSSFLLYIEAQRTRFEESSVSGIKRLISNAVHSAQSLLTMHIIG